MTRHALIVCSIILFLFFIEGIVLYKQTENILGIIAASIGLIFCVIAWFSNFENEYQFPDEY